MRLAFAALAGGAFRAPALDRWILPDWAQSLSRPTGGASVVPAHLGCILAHSDAVDLEEGGAA